ncbi:MAG: hypothetical protein MI974_29925 [Chitinophagales bacterium]|nr:hypothetical protein [Chitinophagales bacterium]
MNISKAYWKYIAEVIERSYGAGPLKTWKQKEIESFLDDLEKKVREACKKNPSKAQLCNIERVKGVYQFHKWRTIDTGTFRRIFITEKTKYPKSATKHQFAIYLGYNSFEDLINQEEIRPESLGNDTIKPAASVTIFQKKNKQRRFQILLVLLLFTFTCALFIWRSNTLRSSANIKTLAEASNAKLQLNTQPPTKELIQAALLDFPFNRGGTVNDDEAKSILLWLGVPRIIRSYNAGAENFYTGRLNTGYELTIWVGTYGYIDRYGIRYTDENGMYSDSNNTYFEIRIP